MIYQKIEIEYKIITFATAKNAIITRYQGQGKHYGYINMCDCIEIRKI